MRQPVSPQPTDPIPYSIPDHLPEPPHQFDHEGIRLNFVGIIEAEPDKGYVPAYHFRIADSDGFDIGHLNFRVGDSSHIQFAVGHIGFEIREAHRGHRSAGSACLAIAPFVAQIYSEVLITADSDNLPSIRTIERIGGEFIDEVRVPESDPHFIRSSGIKRRYRWSPGNFISKSRPDI